MKKIEKEIISINKIIKEAIIYGSKLHGTTLDKIDESDSKDLIRSINSYLKLKNIEEEYDIGVMNVSFKWDYIYKIAKKDSIVRKDMFKKWTSFYNGDDNNMAYLLSLKEANELTLEEKRELLCYADEDDVNNPIVIRILNRG